jgi:hypothetical protein
VPPRPQPQRSLTGYPSALEPATIDCTFDGPWGPDQPRELRFGEGGPAYATAFRTERAHLELAGTGAFVEIEVDGFRFWGHVDHAVLHPARAFLMSGYLLPGFHSTLHPISARQPELTVEIVPPTFVKPLSSQRDTRPCKDFGLSYAEFDPSTALGGQLNGDGYKLPANTPIPLAANHGAPPVAELRFDVEPYVSVVEQRGELARILIDDSYDRDAGISVVGWVSRSLLVHVGASGREGNWSIGAGPPTSSGLSRAKRHVRCTHEVPLIVELGNVRHLAGAIRPDTKFGLIEGPEDTLEITLDRISLQLAPTARAMVKRTDVGDCTDVPR